MVHEKRKAEYLHDWDAFHPLPWVPPVDIFMLNQGLKKSIRELGPDSCCCIFFLFWWWWWKGFLYGKHSSRWRKCLHAWLMQTSVPIHFGSTTMNEVHARIIIAYRLGMRSGREPVYLKATVSAELWNESCDTAFLVFTSAKWTSCYQNGTKMNAMFIQMMTYKPSCPNSNMLE